MEFTTIILITILFGITLLFLYILKSVLDAETFRLLTSKIVAHIVKAENDIQGDKRGIERMYYVMDNITNTATKKERKILNKLNVPELVTGIFTTVVSPILFKKGR